MMQPAQSIMRKNAPRGGGANSVVRGSLPQPKMRAVLMVVTNILGEQSLQMAFIHRDNVVQQVLSATFDPTLRYTVLPGTLEGGADRGYIQGSEGPGNFQPVFRIPIEDEIPGSRPKWKRLPQLLDDPTARRMLRDVNVQDASTIVADDEEAVERAERDRWHGE